MPRSSPTGPGYGSVARYLRPTASPPWNHIGTAWDRVDEAGESVNPAARKVPLASLGFESSKDA